jgi:hypothetical protein
MGLSIIARRLCYDHFVLVKRMGTVETLGSISLLASDKTGTLTQNKMTVTSVLTVQDDVCTALAADDAAVQLMIPPEQQEQQQQQQQRGQLEPLLRIAVLCNQGKLQAVATRSRLPTADNDNDLEAQVNNGEHGTGNTTTAAAASGTAAAAAVTGTSSDVEVVSSNGIDKALLQWGVQLGQVCAIMFLIIGSAYVLCYYTIYDSLLQHCQCIVVEVFRLRVRTLSPQQCDHCKPCRSYIVLSTTVCFLIPTGTESKADIRTRGISTFQFYH